MDNQDRNEIALSAEVLEQKQQEIELKEKELAEKESMIKKAEDRIAKAKYNLYDKIDVDLSTMDKMIGVVALALVAAILYAIVSR
ncbi:hypothetical protein [Anaerotignum sp.]|uniref:hypothetical protein n=1 Tax=Anaerotignum sp. TaxID=2039241 RepID=UPI00331CC675